MLTPTLVGAKTGKKKQDLPFKVLLKPTQPMGYVVWYAAAGKSCAFNTQHLVASEKKTARNGSGSDIPSENSGHTALTTLKLGSEHSQSCRAYIRPQRFYVVSCPMGRGIGGGGRCCLLKAQVGV